MSAFRFLNLMALALPPISGPDFLLMKNNGGNGNIEQNVSSYQLISHAGIEISGIVLRKGKRVIRRACAGGQGHEKDYSGFSSRRVAGKCGL